jgi:hypothetical protein
MSATVLEVQHVNAIGNSSPFSEAKLTPHPELLFPRRLIVTAFEEAKRTRNGRPTEEAREALAWIQERTDWTLIPLERRMKEWGAPCPPPEVWCELYGSFEWACNQLGEDPEEVRRNGMPYTKGYAWCGGTGGVAQILAVWEEARVKFEAARLERQMSIFQS